MGPGERLFQFISTYFEILLAVDVFIFIGLFVIQAAARVRTYQPGRLINSAFYYLLVTLQVFLVGLTLTVVFTNLRQKQPLDLTAQIEPTTRWVREDQTIYFIDGEKLVSIQADGSHRQVVYRAGERIKQYHFSLDGRFLAITTPRRLLLFNRVARTARLIDEIKVTEGPDRRLRGNIDGIQWAPGSRRFCYRLSQWSDVAGTERWKIYDLNREQSVDISHPVMRFTSLMWDRSGGRVYGGRYVRREDADGEEAYRCNVYEISGPDADPRRVWAGVTERMELPARRLSREGIHLFIPARRYSFGRVGQKRTTAYSRQGAEIGVDDNDTLYYSALWWRKRLYRVPRVAAADDMTHYQYRGGRLTINDLRFLPSGRYVIMEHYFWGILILDPVSGRIGILDNQRGSTFGWYPK